MTVFEIVAVAESVLDSHNFRLDFVTFVLLVIEFIDLLVPFENITVFFGLKSSISSVRVFFPYINYPIRSLRRTSSLVVSKHR